MSYLVVSDAPSVPVTESGIPVRNLWYMLLYAFDQAAYLGSWQAEVESAPSLDALLATLLTRLVRQRLRIGLGRGYRHHEELRRGLKGRVDFSESIRRLAFEHGQAYCHFHDYSIDVPKNQIIRTALARLVHAGEMGPDQGQARSIRQQLRQMVRELDGVSEVEVTPAMIRRQPLGRNEQDYRLMLAICELITRRLMPTQQAGHSMQVALNRDAMILHDVYERFVANFLRTHLVGWSVRPQARLSWHETKTSPYLPGMQADIVLEHRQSGRLVVLDTKFTRKSLQRNRFGKAMFNSDHLYQMYAYLRSQEHLSEPHRAAEGILLYPTVQDTVSETVELQGHQIRFESIDLRLNWQGIHASLLTMTGASVG